MIAIGSDECLDHLRQQEQICPDDWRIRSKSLPVAEREQVKALRGRSEPEAAKTVMAVLVADPQDETAAASG